MRAQLNGGVIITVLLTLSVATNVYLFVALRGHRIEEVSPRDRTVLDRAFNEKARQESVPLATIKRLNKGIVVHFSQEACVELSPTTGVTGGTTVSCYDNRTGAITRKEIIGD